MNHYDKTSVYTISLFCLNVFQKKNVKLYTRQAKIDLINAYT